MRPHIHPPGEFLENLSDIASTDATNPVELQARRSQRKMRVVPTMFRAAGERLMLCRLDAADLPSAMPHASSANLERLFNEGADGIVFLDGEGMITGANDAFLKLADITTLANLRGRSMADFLARGSVDLRLLLDNPRRARQLRLHATKISNDFEGQVPVEISATFLTAEGDCDRNHRCGGKDLHSNGGPSAPPPPPPHDAQAICAMVGGRVAATAVQAMLVSGRVTDLKLARKPLMKEHGTVFRVLRSRQDAYYKSDARRERFVSLC